MEFWEACGRLKCLEVIAAPWSTTSGWRIFFRGPCIAEMIAGEMENQWGNKRQLCCPRWPDWSLLVSSEIWILFVSSVVHCWSGMGSLVGVWGRSKVNRSQLQKVRGAFQKQRAGSVTVPGCTVCCCSFRCENPVLWRELWIHKKPQW